MTPNKNMLVPNNNKTIILAEMAAHTISLAVFTRPFYHRSWNADLPQNFAVKASRAIHFAIHSF